MRGLFDRLRADERAGGRVDEVVAIIEHLRALLNTRLGSAVTAPSLGVLDLSDAMTQANGVNALLRSIQATIVEYEPRLTNVSVRHRPASGEPILRFDITAQLARSSRTLRLSTSVRPGGRVDVGT